MPQARERLLQWLRDAHAMEEQAETMLSRTAQRIENYPLLKSKLEEHLGQTQRQAARVEECIQRLNGEASSLKDTGGSVMGFAQAVSGAVAGDEVMKAALASYTFEHMEIASYKMLAEAVEEAGEPEIRQVCEEILGEEEAMAEWLKHNLPSTTQQFLQREASEQAAKR